MTYGRPDLRTLFAFLIDDPVRTVKVRGWDIDDALAKLRTRYGDAVRVSMWYVEAQGLPKPETPMRWTTRRKVPKRKTASGRP